MSAQTSQPVARADVTSSLLSSIGRVLIIAISSQIERPCLAKRRIFAAPPTCLLRPARNNLQHENEADEAVQRDRAPRPLRGARPASACRFVAYGLSPAMLGCIASAGACVWVHPCRGGERRISRNREIHGGWTMMLAINSPVAVRASGAR
jgi:hypothetical protein